MNRRRFIKSAAGVLVPATFGIFVPRLVRAQAVLPNRRKLFQAAAAGGGGDPGDLTGVELWLRASDASGNNVSCYTDAGTTLATDGQTIQQWNDESGNGNHVSQATAGARPFWESGEVNGKAVTRYDAGTSKHFTVPNVFTGLTAAEFFIVVKADNDPAAGTDQAEAWSDWGTSGLISAYPYTDGVVYDDWGSSVRRTVGDLTPSLASWRLYNVSTQSGDWTARLDTSQVFNTGTNTVAFGTAPLIGRSSDGRHFNGQIAEIVVLDHVASTDDRTFLQDYFDDMYALSY